MRYLGTSAGSIVAALYSLGYTPDEMIKLFNYFAKSVMTPSPKHIFTKMKEIKGIRVGGLMTSYGIESAIEESAKLKNISNINQIKMPIAIPTVDLISNKEIIFTNSDNLQGDEYIHDMEIGKAVRASSSFPGMYEPLEYKNFQFADGGIFNNLPSKQVKDMGVDKVISIRFIVKPTRKQRTMYNITMQSLDLMSEKLIEKSVKISDYVIDLDLKDVKPFSINKLEYSYNQGYMQTIDNIKEIKKMLG